MMSDALTFAEIDEQHAELLPPRTVLSLFGAAGGGLGGGGSGDSGSGNGGVVMSSCTDFAQPNQAVGPLGLGGATAWTSHSCIPAARMPS